MAYFAALLDPRIATAESPLEGEPANLLNGLMGDEALSVARAVPKRRREFAIGRACARQAMAALGQARVPIPQGQYRNPIWPHELVGSITHTDTWAAAAVARRSDGFVAVGIDLEPANELEADLWLSVCNPREQAKVVSSCGMTPGLAAHLLFCMKEAAFKCQFPLSGVLLDFTDFAIEVDADAGAFLAIFQKAAAPFHADDRLSGRFAISGDHIASAVVITKERAP